MFGEGDEENIRGEVLLLWSRHLIGGMWEDVHEQICPIWGKKWAFLLLVQFVLSPVCLSHRKAEAGTLRGQMERRQEHLSGCDLWEVVVVYCCFLFDYSALVSVGEQVSAAFIIIESQNISTWKGP